MTGRSTHIWSALIALSTWAALDHHLGAQETLTSGADEGLDASEVRKRIQRFGEDRELDEALKTKVVELYRQTHEQLEQAS